MTLHNLDEYLYSKTGLRYLEMNPFLAETLSNTFMFENRQQTASNTETWMKDTIKLWVLLSISMLNTMKTHHQFLKGIEIPDSSMTKQRLLKELEMILTTIEKL